MTKKEEWLAGTRSAVPIMLGYVPVGIAYGVMARLNTWQTVLMSLTVYGGASEMMAAGMVAQGAAVLTTFILNLRHIIMSTCVFNQMQGGRLPVRMLAAFGVTDETFAVYTTTANAPRTPRASHNHYSLFSILCLIKNKPGPVQDAHGAGLCL